MKKYLKVLAVILSSAVLLTGCATSNLRSTYKTMQIAEGKLSGYQMNIRLYGLYNDEKVTQIISVQNYMNKTYKVVNSYENETYYQIDGTNYAFVEGATDEESDELEEPADEPTIEIQRPSFGLISEDDELSGSSSVVSGSYKETDVATPFTNTDIYLTSLDKAKDISDPETDTISEIAYTKYSYTVSKNVMKRIVQDTALKDAEFVNDTNASVWIDSNGYVYKIEYDLASGLDLTYDLVLNIYISSVNEVQELTTEDLR